jgi:hypothetical protein
MGYEILNTANLPSPDETKGVVLLVPGLGHNGSGFRELSHRLMDDNYTPVPVPISTFSGRNDGTGIIYNDAVTAAKILQDKYGENVFGVGHSDGGRQVIRLAQDGHVSYSTALNAPIGDMDAPPNSATSIYTVFDELGLGIAKTIQDLLILPSESHRWSSHNSNFSNIPLFGLGLEFTHSGILENKKAIENVVYSLHAHQSVTTRKRFPNAIEKQSNQTRFSPHPPAA